MPLFIQLIRECLFLVGQCLRAALLDNALLEFHHLAFKDMLLLKDVAKGGVVLAFDASLEVLKVLLKLKHLGACWWCESLPGRDDHLLESWVGELECLKAEGFFRSIAWSGPLKRNGPVI